MRPPSKILNVSLLLGTLLLICQPDHIDGSKSRYESSSSSEETEVDCVRLPPSPERTSVQGERTLNISSFFNGVITEMMNIDVPPPQDVILVLGNTGSGKTTLTQILSTNLSRLHAVQTNSGKDMVIIDDDDRIGVPSTVSRTLIPELVMASSSNESMPTIYFYDCPGFDDSRGPDRDLAANFFMNQIIRKVTRVKLLFLTPEYSVDGRDRGSFPLLVQHATEFVKNLGQFVTSIGLVVTKVSNYSSGKGRFNKDSKILQGIVDFLSTYNSTLHIELNQLTDTTSRDSILKKIDFLRILLSTDENGNFDKIAFSRTPENCGPLENEDVVKRSKEMIAKLYQSLEYSEVGDPRRNFGYTLKPETVNNIQNYNNHANQAIVESVQKLMTNFTEWFDRVKFSGGYDEVISISQQMQSFWPVVDNLLKNLPQDPTEFATVLKSSLKQLGYYETPEQWTLFMTSQTNLLRFFDEVTGTPVVRTPNDWAAPIATFHRKLGEYRDWYSFCAQVKMRVVTYAFHSKNIQNAPENLLQVDWLDWIGRQGVVLVGDHLKSIGSDLNAKNRNVLGDIMKWSLEPVHIWCAGGVVNVQGNFVRFRDFLEVTGESKGNCRDAKAIQVYSKDTVFIDTNLNAVGKEMSMVVMAPHWQVVGKVHFNLDGGNASPIHPLKASAGTWLGARGINGLPGKPGGRAGAFLGVASNIIEASGLTISANGGNGGRGQDGDDGAGGRDGTSTPFKRVTDDNAFSYRVRFGRHGTSGWAGGNGGSAGVGGLGGKAGSVHILSQDGGRIIISQKEGMRGTCGNVGWGGEGGKGSVTEKCYKKVTMMIAHDDPCTYTTHPDGPKGYAGVGNEAVEGLEQPNEPYTAPDVTLAKNYYRFTFEKTGNKETIAFISTF